MWYRVGCTLVWYRTRVVPPGYTPSPAVLPLVRASSPAHAEVRERDTLGSDRLPRAGRRTRQLTRARFREELRKNHRGKLSGAKSRNRS